MSRSPEDSATRSTSRDAPLEPVRKRSPAARRRDGTHNGATAPRDSEVPASRANGRRARFAAFSRPSRDLRRQRPAWRLGRLEYVLLALILLGVAVTIAMAVFNPSG